MILADVLPPIPWSTTGQWLLGLFAFVAVIGSVLFTINQAKKLFGRTPPLDEELSRKHKKIFGEIEHGKNAVKKELRAEMHAQTERIEKLEERYDELQLDRERKWNTLQKEMHELELKLATFTGRIEQLLKKLESQ